MPVLLCRTYNINPVTPLVPRKTFYIRSISALPHRRAYHPLTTRVHYGNVDTSQIAELMTRRICRVSGRAQTSRPSSYQAIAVNPLALMKPKPDQLFTVPYVMRSSP